MVGKLQDVLTAAVVINSAEQVKGGRIPKADAVSAERPRVVMATEPPKVQKTEALDNLFERDEEYKPFEDGPRLEPGTLDEETVSLMTETFNELMSKINCNLEFKYNKEVNLMTIKMVDKRTNEVIKEVPPEEMIENMVRAKDWLGAFIDKNM